MAIVTPEQAAKMAAAAGYKGSSGPTGPAPTLPSGPAPTITGKGAAPTRGGPVAAYSGTPAQSQQASASEAQKLASSMRARKRQQSTVSGNSGTTGNSFIGTKLSRAFKRGGMVKGQCRDYSK